MAADTSAMETTLVLIKPDAVARRLAGEIVRRFERKGLQIAGVKMLRIPRRAAEEQYAAHRDKDFYEPLVRYMSDRPVIALALRGKGAVGIVRALTGSTFGSEAAPGTIRGDLALSNRFNLIHAADSPEAAQRELAIYFEPDELFQASPADLDWLYDTSGGELV